MVPRRTVVYEAESTVLQTDTNVYINSCQESDGPSYGRWSCKLEPIRTDNWRKNAQGVCIEEDDEDIRHQCTQTRKSCERRLEVVLEY